ncbi:MAG: hypothetical protein CM15mP12_1440 [Gammaproteobacteria bacterium]|nr:MAG: hypothetical protein CM15mP12_1440 [Gammaproteobacteria bacterium]
MKFNRAWENWKTVCFSARLPGCDCAVNECKWQPDGLILQGARGRLHTSILFLSTKEVLRNMSPGSHGSTFGGNPLASAIGKRSLELLYEDNLIENSRIMELL